MTSPALAPYHVGEQKAAVLLGPIDAALAELEARLAHYALRLRMPDADRAALQHARDVLARARAEIAGHAGGAA